MKIIKHNITTYLNVFVQLSTKEHLFTNKKSEIKNTHDHIVFFFFLMFI